MSNRKRTSNQKLQVVAPPIQVGEGGATEHKGCFFDMESGREVHHRVTDLLNEDSTPSTGTANAPAAPGVREELE